MCSLSLLPSHALVEVSALRLLDYVVCCGNGGYELQRVEVTSYTKRYSLLPQHEHLGRVFCQIGHTQDHTEYKSSRRIHLQNSDLVGSHFCTH